MICRVFFEKMVLNVGVFGHIQFNLKQRINNIFGLLNTFGF